MSWTEYEEIAFGLLNLSRQEYRDLRIKDVFIKLRAHKDRENLAEVRNRRLCYHLVLPYWDEKKNGPLFQKDIFEIPDIDKHFNPLEHVKLASIKKVSENELIRTKDDHDRGGQTSKGHI